MWRVSCGSIAPKAVRDRADGGPQRANAKYCTYSEPGKRRRQTVLGGRLTKDVDVDVMTDVFIVGTADVIRRRHALRVCLIPTY